MNQKGNDLNWIIQLIHEKDANEWIRERHMGDVIQEKSDSQRDLRLIQVAGFCNN